MVKRKSEDDDESYEEGNYDKSVKLLKRNVRPKIILENCPNVNCLNDLIEIGKTNKFYKNINTIMLWDILQNLIDLQSMIGMKGLKETVFYQIIYYLQNMHKKNRNEEYLHTIIMGSAGCGKTTVAKIIGNMYKNMGILSRDGVSWTNSC